MNVSKHFALFASSDEDPIKFNVCHSWYAKYPSDKYGELASGLCISDYTLSLTGILLFASIIYQLYNYRSIYKVKWNDKRISILLLCLFSTANSALRYATFISIWKEKTFFLVEIFRFVIFFADCYYFCSKSSNLLPNREHVKWLLQVIFGFLFGLSILFAAYIFILRTRGSEQDYTGPDEIKTSHLCTTKIFLSFRWISAVFCVIFGTIFILIRNKSRQIVIETEIDKINQAIQEDTLRRLGIAISCFLLISLFESFLDILANYLIALDPITFNCDYLFTSDNSIVLNSLYHFFSRGISNFSAIFVTLYLFWKKHVSKAKQKEHELKLKYGPTFEIEYREGNSNITLSNYHEDNSKSSTFESSQYQDNIESSIFNENKTQILNQINNSLDQSSNFGHLTKSKRDMNSKEVVEAMLTHRESELNDDN